MGKFFSRIQRYPGRPTFAVLDTVSTVYSIQYVKNLGAEWGTDQSASKMLA